LHALLWKRSGECPGAVPVFVCHDEIVVECDAEQAAEAKGWLEEAMIEVMDAVIKGIGTLPVPVEIEVRIARSWGEGS
jgi:DNA polymerase I-like protein with 3'-5' exonuclease and polymerase domains